MIKIDIETDQLIERKKRDGSGVYYQQQAFAHTTDQHGNPKRYPEEITIFPQREPNGQVKAYPKGQYKIAPQSLRVQRGSLELGIPQLIALKGQQ